MADFVTCVALACSVICLICIAGDAVVSIIKWRKQQITAKEPDRIAHEVPMTLEQVVAELGQRYIHNGNEPVSKVTIKWRQTGERHSLTEYKIWVMEKE